MYIWTHTNIVIYMYTLVAEGYMYMYISSGLGLVKSIFTLWPWVAIDGCLSPSHW